MKLPFHKQKNDHNCGPAVLQMVFEYLGVCIPQEEIAAALAVTHEGGAEHENMIHVATQNGFYCYVNNNSTFFEIRHFLTIDLPVIVHFIEPSGDEGHYAVLTKYSGRGDMLFNDPWNGENFPMPKKEFLRRWHDSKNAYKKWIMVLAKRDFHLGKQFLPQEISA